jgi:hypothetical protein
VSVRLAFVGLATLVACGDRQATERPVPSPVETAIARDLTARFGTPVTARCVVLTVVPLKCTATLGDGTELPIAIEHARKEWGWRVDGRVIETKSVVQFVQEHLANIHVTQAVDCGTPVQVVKPSEQLVCKLAGGGAAFIAFAPDGEASIELALDPASAAARMELTSSDRDRELTKQSAELESRAGDSDGEEAVPASSSADAGVP